MKIASVLVRFIIVSGAPHASGIPYMFDNLGSRNGAAVAHKDQELAEMMSSY